MKETDDRSRRCFLKVAQSLSGFELKGGARLPCSRVRVFWSTILSFPLGGSDSSSLGVRRVPRAKKNPHPSQES